MKKAILFLAIVALASCGGGSTSSEPTTVDSTVVKDTVAVNGGGVETDTTASDPKNESVIK